MKALCWQIGDVTITRVEERVVSMSPSVLLPEATPEALARHASWLRPYFIDDEGTFRLSIHGLIVESRGLRILVDTCVGERILPGFEGLSEGPSPFLERLSEAGFPRESIDVVLCTHLHFDHVGWNTMQDREAGELADQWKPTFPNARYLFARVEWEHWQKAPNSPFVAVLDETVRPIVDAGLADLVETNHRLTDDVRLEPTPGHTPGHVAVRIDSQDQHALITGDLTHHPVQWAEPDWKVTADVDTKQASRTRHRLIADHGDSSMLVIGTHYAPPSAGHILRSETGCVFRALWSGGDR